MENPLGAILDQDLSRLVTVIANSYLGGTLPFLQEYFPSFRGTLDQAEERVGRLRHDLLAGDATLAGWQTALDELRGLWELASQLRREHDEQEAVRVEEVELVAAEA